MQPSSFGTRLVGRLLAGCYYAAVSVLLVGFLFHRSVGTTSWYPYSFSYTILLVGVASTFAVPSVLARLRRRIGVRNFLMSLVPVGVVATFLYAIAALSYYYSTTHYFDPYLQIPPPKLERADFSNEPNTFRILALGGSTTGNYNLAHEQKYPTVLEQLLNERIPTTRFDVFNAGANWYSSKHSLINYVTQMRDWRANIVVIMHGINDLQRSFSDTYYAQGPYDRLYSHFYGAAINGARPPTFEQHLLRTRLAPLRLAWFSEIRRNEVDLQIDEFVSIEAFDRNLRTLLDYVRSDGAIPIIVSQPSLYKLDLSEAELRTLFFAHSTCKEETGFLRYQFPSPRSMKNALDAFNTRARDLAADESVAFVDAASVVPRDLDHFIDDVHYTAPAARLIAEVVAEAIATAGSITNSVLATSDPRDQALATPN